MMQIAWIHYVHAQCCLLSLCTCICSCSSKSKVYTFMHINIVASLMCGSIFLLAGTAESAWRVTVSCTVGKCMYRHAIYIST